VTVPPDEKRVGELGYATANGLDIGPDGTKPERANYGDVLLVERVRAAIARLNPTLKAEALADVLAKLTQTDTPSLVAENRRLHRFIVEGVQIEFQRSDGSIGHEHARLIDFNEPGANDWLVVNQYTVIENKANRRPDVVIFVNGLPLGVIELKNPADENATLDGAFNQLQTYKAQIVSLFRTNAALIISDGIAARIGSLTAEFERFMPWRTVTGDDPAPRCRDAFVLLAYTAHDPRHLPCWADRSYGRHPHLRRSRRARHRVVRARAAGRGRDGTAHAGSQTSIRMTRCFCLTTQI
jgi:type I restriction enzyme R subunit